MGLAREIERLNSIFARIRGKEACPVPDLNALIVFATVVEANSVS
jgi:hypothetical protein